MKSAIDEVKAETVVATAKINELNTRISMLSDQNATLLIKEHEQIVAVAAGVNRLARFIEIGTALALITVGAIGAINYITGMLNDSVVWSGVLGAVGVFGFLRLIFAILERPLPGLSTLLTHVVQIELSKRLSKLGLAGSRATQGIEFSKGRVRVDGRIDYHSPRKR